MSKCSLLVLLVVLCSASTLPAARTTLGDKAKRCEETIFAHHLQDGLLISERVQAGKQFAADNSGLRTGCLLSALSHEYAVTKQAATRQRAAQVFRALERLESITGVPGMTARHYRKAKGPGPEEAGWLVRHYHQAGPYRWLGNVSTDEMTYYLTGLRDYCQRCAEPAQRTRAAALVGRVVGRQLDRGMRITEANGAVTTWGDCSRETPKEPLFCLHGLHYLKTAEVVTGEARFARAYREFAADPAYLDRAVHAYLRDVQNFDWAYFDWQLATASYECVIAHDTTRRAQFQAGLAEMAADPRSNVFPHLATALCKQGGEGQVKEWLTAFQPERADGVELGWYLWVYWKAREGGLIAAQQ